MSAERSTESIVDLLYGELSEEEAKEMRAELAESAELRAEYDELDMMLGRVRTAMPIVDVSPAIHDAIMEAARAGVPTGVDERMMRRGTPESRGFWSRASGQGSQLALVAAVLVAGLFVVRFVDKPNSPLHSPSADISNMQEAAPSSRVAAPAPMAEMEAEEAPQELEPTAGLDDGFGAMEPKPAAEGSAVADQWSASDDSLDRKYDGDTKAEPVDPLIANSLRKELGRAFEPTPKADAPATAEKVAPTKREAKKVTAKPAPRARASSVPSDKSKDSAPAPELKAATKGDSASLDLFGADEDSAGMVAPSRSTSSSSAGSVAPVQAEPSPAPEAAEEEAKQQYRAPNNSIDTVNQYFRRGDYPGAIRAADEFLVSNTSASNTEKATAMHIKAQSLAKSGKYTEADRLYQQIQTNYPGYQSASVRDAREELRSRNTKRKARPASPKKAAEESKSYDFESSSD